MNRLPEGLSIGLGLFTGQAEEPASGPTLRHAPSLAHAAEEAGFDAFWVSEHHGLADGYLPAPLPVLAAAASVTTRIVLGTGLAVAPLYHPVRLAEDSAVVDILSEGRLILGLGIGYADHEFDMFDVDRRKRGAAMDELVPFLRGAWAGAPVRPPGQRESVQVSPPPVGQIPIWLGGYADAALSRAATRGDGHLIGRGDRAVVEQCEAQLCESAPDRSAFTIGVNFLTVMEGPGLYADAARKSFLIQQRRYEQFQRANDPYSGSVDIPLNDDLTPEAADAYLHATGTAEAVATALRARLEPLRGWPRVHLVIRAIFPSSDIDLQTRRIHALGRDVLPRLRDGGWAVEPGS